jgi:hypothetical protein
MVPNIFERTGPKFGSSSFLFQIWDLVMVFFKFQ